VRNYRQDRPVVGAIGSTTEPRPEHRAYPQNLGRRLVAMVLASLGVLLVLGASALIGFCTLLVVAIGVAVAVSVLWLVREPTGDLPALRRGGSPINGVDRPAQLREGALSMSGSSLPA
jgi:hypothetical protein